MQSNGTQDKTKNEQQLEGDRLADKSTLTHIYIRIITYYI